MAGETERLLHTIGTQVAQMHEEWPRVMRAIISGEVRMNEHERRIQKLENVVEDTGKHDVRKLEEQLKENRGERRESFRDWKIWALGIAASLFVSACGGGAALAAQYFIGGH